MNEPTVVSKITVLPFTLHCAIGELILPDGEFKSNSNLGVSHGCS